VSIRLILDTSALLAYVAADTRAMDVGELLLTVQENGDTTGVPALCLIEAYQQIPESAQAKLMELVGDDGMAILLPVLAADVAAIAHLALQLTQPPAHAVTETRKHHAMLGTYYRKIYADTLAAEDILDL